MLLAFNRLSIRKKEMALLSRVGVWTRGASSRGRDARCDVVGFSRRWASFSFVGRTMRRGGWQGIRSRHRAVWCCPPGLEDGQALRLIVLPSIVLSSFLRRASRFGLLCERVLRVPATLFADVLGECLILCACLESASSIGPIDACIDLEVQSHSIRRPVPPRRLRPLPVPPAES